MTTKTFKTQFSVRRDDAKRVCRDWKESGYVLSFCDIIPGLYAREDVLIFNAVVSYRAE